MGIAEHTDKHKRFTLDKCKTCSNEFQPVTWLNWRKFGYCSEQCWELSFDFWFAECAISCVDQNIGPDEYLWDLENCDEWRARFRLGMTPSDAVNSVFKSN